eukprot:2345941-Pyramimonas_sp.AAC.1
MAEPTRRYLEAGGATLISFHAASAPIAMTSHLLSLAPLVELAVDRDPLAQSTRVARGDRV